MTESVKGKLAPDIAAKITKIAASGVTGRGPSVLCADRLWQEAIDLIEQSTRIAILTGFYVPSVSAMETDGPPGALVLARALQSVGRTADVFTDNWCGACVAAAADAIGYPSRQVKVWETGADMEAYDLYIYVERLGRAADGRYYNMRREDITEWTEPLDAFALDAGRRVIGIGDGGNEVGMGSYRDQLFEIMPDFRDCLCVVPSTVCLPVDVSNWGAYALTAALSVAYGRWLGHRPREEEAMIEALCRCGTVDGRLKVCAKSVDGMPLEAQQDVVRALKEATGL